jgi:DNA-binding transcriptional LysR family regulator
MTEESGPLRPLRGLSVERIEAFLAVAEAGGIAKAAPGNPSRQSQLSRQLRDVSAALGFEVMARDGHGMALTAGGARVRAVLREMVDGLAAARAAQAGAPVAATLAAGDSVLRWLVLPRVHAALAEAPGVELAVRAVTRGFDAVRDGEFDLALSRSRRKPDGLASAPVGTLRYALFAPRALHRRAVAALPLVHVTGAPEAMATIADALGASPSVALRCETFPQAALAVASGHYAALLPALAAAELPASVAPHPDAPALRALDLRLALVARERRLASVPALAALYAALARHLKRALTR